MEDGTPGEALLLLAWPLAIIGFIVVGILLIFPRTRKVAWGLTVIIVVAMCGAILAGSLSGRKRTRVEVHTEQIAAPLPSEGAPSDGR